MSATEELRRMLDERGVKHLDTAGITEWDGVYGRICRAYERPEPMTVDVTMIAVPPEQAIEATIGRTTTRHGKHKTRWGREVPLCEQCGHAIGDSRYHYCPNCGARIIEEGA